LKTHRRPYPNWIRKYERWTSRWILLLPILLGIIHWIYPALGFSYSFGSLAFLGGLGLILASQNNFTDEPDEDPLDAAGNTEASKEELRNRLLADVAHELRNALALVQGPLSLLDDDLQDATDEIRLQVDTANRNAKRLSRMVDQLLDLTRLEVNELHLKKEAYNINEQVVSLLNSYQAMANKKGVSFTRLLPNREVIVNADRDRIEQVFSNLISNAIKFSPEGGYIDISVSVEEDGVRIQVKDTGVGIPEEAQNKLFNRYFTRGARNVSNREGLGIGLSMSYDYVRQHGGELSVESEPGKGAKFIVWLPTIQDDTLRGYSIDPQVQQEGYARADSDSSFDTELVYNEEVDEEEFLLRVLIVEDDAELRNYMSGIVRKECQVAVIGVSTVEEAWTLLGEQDIDLVITDLQLPEEDGFSLITRIQDSFELRLLPILILTGRKEKRDRIRGFQIGINDFMSKPFDPKELVVRVQNLLRNKIERDLWSGNSFAAVPPNSEDHVEKFPSNRLEPFQKDDRTYHKYELMLLEKIVRFVNDQLTNNTMTVDDLAHHLALSTRQLYRKCKELTGLTPAHLIREIRLDEARKMLEDNKVQTVSELMHAVGFNSSGYFSKLYEERFGKRPTDYL
jgi:signal transduction histidine kinase/DNA-binding response OmpR family regulator